ncbi:MAG TPA: hypothetical protein VJZ76_07755 [Thermoanaerobaculia bacterium]|nr:hypothetical protein [Thermoanaerobaculia bacterium]
MLVDEPRHSLWQQVTAELDRILSAAAAEVQSDIEVRIALNPVSEVPTCFIGHAASREWKTPIDDANGEHCWILTSGGALSDEEVVFDGDRVLRLSHVYSRVPHFHDWFLAWIHAGLDRQHFRQIAGELIQPTSRNVISVCRRLQITATSLHAITGSALAAVRSRPSAEAEIIDWAVEGIQLALADTDLHEVNVDYTFLRFAVKDKDLSKRLRHVFHPRTGAVVHAVEWTRAAGDLERLDKALANGLSWLAAVVSGELNLQDQLCKLEDQLRVVVFALARLARGRSIRSSRFVSIVQSEWAVHVLRTAVALTYPPADDSRWLIGNYGHTPLHPGALQETALVRAAADVELLRRLLSFDVERASVVHEGNNRLMAIVPMIDLIDRFRAPEHLLRRQNALQRLTDIAANLESNPPRIIEFLTTLETRGFQMTTVFRRESEDAIAALRRLPRHLGILKSNDSREAVEAIRADMRLIRNTLSTIRSTQTFGFSVVDLHSSLMDGRGR